MVSHSGNPFIIKTANESKITSISKMYWLFLLGNEKHLWELLLGIWRLITTNPSRIILGNWGEDQQDEGINSVAKPLTEHVINFLQGGVRCQERVFVGEDQQVFLVSVDQTVRLSSLLSPDKGRLAVKDTNRDVYVVR